MSKKDKVRHHELKDAARTETLWIQPIHEDVPSTPKAEAKTHQRKATTMRENKKSHQHQFRHDHEVRQHDNKRAD